MREMMPFMCSAAARDSSSWFSRFVSVGGSVVLVQKILVREVTVQQAMVHQDLVVTGYGGVWGFRLRPITWVRIASSWARISVRKPSASPDLV